MPSVNQSAFIWHTPKQMFDLVNDFERYPEFLPECRRASVVEQGDGYLIGQMTLAKGGVEQIVTTRNDLEQPERIDLSLVDGPFKRLSGRWHFRAMGKDACKIELKMSFEFSNRLLRMVFGRLFQQVAGQLVFAFTRRADQVYGCQAGIPMVSIEVAFATPEYQTIVCVPLEPGINARQAIILADLPSRCLIWAEFDFARAPLGIFGQRLISPEDYQPLAGDRIEVYRPLELDPKQARRERADKTLQRVEQPVC